MAKKYENLKRSDLFKADPRIIVVDPGWNPREDFDPEEMEVLRESIRENGVLNPLHVRLVDEVPHLVDGECRLRAVLELIEEGVPFQEVPCLLVRHGTNDADRLLISLLANTGNRLSPIEEARAFRRLQNWGMTPAQIARRMGVTDQTVYNRLKLLEAAPAVQQMIQRKELTVTDAMRAVRSGDGSVEAQTKAAEIIKTAKEAPKPKDKKPTTALFVVVVHHTDDNVEVMLTRATGPDEIHKNWEELSPTTPKKIDIHPTKGDHFYSRIYMGRLADT